MCKRHIHRKCSQFSTIHDGRSVSIHHQHIPPALWLSAMLNTSNNLLLGSLLYLVCWTHAKHPNIIAYNLQLGTLGLHSCLRWLFHSYSKYNWQPLKQNHITETGHPTLPNGRVSNIFIHYNSLFWCIMNWSCCKMYMLPFAIRK